MTRTLAAALATTAIMALPTLAQDAASVLGAYADIAEAKYRGGLATAEDLQAVVEALIAEPSEAALKAAQGAWIAASVPYEQTEVTVSATPSWTGGRAA